MQCFRPTFLAAAIASLLWALPALADEATGSAKVSRQVLQLHAGIGVLPVQASVVPKYYSHLGMYFEAPITGPLGIRLGGEFYPSAFNDWTTQFSGYSGDLDLTLAAARQSTSSMMPFLALGNRLMGVTYKDTTVPQTLYSLSLLMGARFPGGFAAELRYPLYQGGRDLPASFETTVGWWKGL